MDISQKTIFNKMEQCLLKAKGSDDSREAREHIRALQALCDVLLNDLSQEDSSHLSVKREVYSTPIENKKIELHSKKLETEDGSNGDSLFDF